MTNRQCFALASGVYYLALGVWAGSLAMLAVAAAATFRTIRGSMPEMDASIQNMIAGSIVGNAIAGLAVIQIICALLAGGVLLLQCTAFADRVAGGLVNKLRIALVLLPIVILVADRLVISPRLHANRQAMHGEVDQNVRAAAKASFDQYHKLSEKAAGAMMFLVAVAMLVSPFVLGATDPRRALEQDHGEKE